MNRSVRIGALVLLWLIPIFIFSWALSWDWLATWREFRLPSALPHFLDLAGIPGGLESLRLGEDPLISNPGDPIGRPLNYPRVWLYLFQVLGVNQRNLVYVGLSFCAFYLACMSFLIIKAQHWLDMIVLLVASLSLAPLLAVERGNNDLFVCSLVFLGCVVSSKNLKSGILAVATLLKIYPCAAMVADAVRRPVKERDVPYILTAAVIFLFTLQWYDVILIAHNTPSSPLNSYGVVALREHLVSLYPQALYFPGMGWMVIAGCWVAGALAVATAWEKPWQLDPSIRRSRYSEMFSVFGAMYVFTYAVSSNFDYRLILLLPTIPLALEMARNSQHMLGGISHLVLVGITLNAFAFNQGLGQLTEFCLFVFLLTFLTLQAKGELLATSERVATAEAQ